MHLANELAAGHIEVEPNGVADLLHPLGIVGQLERLGAVRLAGRGLAIIATRWCR